MGTHSGLQEFAAFATTTASDTAPRGESRPMPETVRVLVIDDNPAIHDDIRKILIDRAEPEDLSRLEDAVFGSTTADLPSGDAFEVGTALDGRSGVELAREALAAGQPFTVAFVDQRMPAGWDGLETIERLWKVDPRIQIVICTAYSDRSWSEISKKLGPSDGWLVLKKPFETIEVLQTAHALGRKWALGQQLEGHVSDLENQVARRTRELQRVNEELRVEIDERRAAEANLMHLATHDPLTGLANRLLLREQLNLAIARARRFKKPLAFLLCDLDDFKEINDTLGHDAGDDLICQVANRLRGCARDCDTVARLGGDEFALVLSDLQEAESSAIVARRIGEALSRTFELAGAQRRVSASIGIAVLPDDCGSAEDLIKYADVALYEAKADGKGTFKRYSQGSASKVQSRVHLRDELQQALDRQQFVLWYQPLYDLTNAAVVGTEALLRWCHPERGIVGPLEFMHTAESTGLIVAIGRWVLREACRQTAAWHHAGGPAVGVSVNLSARQFEQTSLVAEVEQALADSGLAARHLTLEVTESCVMRDVELSNRTLGALHDLGVQIAIDDFGSGHSSLARLKTLRVDVLKLDRLFVQNVAHDKRDASIVAAVIALAGTLGLQVIAEGIETAEQLQALQTISWDPRGSVQCQIGQGYLFSKPLPAEDAWRVLSRK